MGNESYRDAGVNIDAGYRAVELMKEHAKRTKTDESAFEGLGGFGGLFAPSLKGIKNPVLVSGTDGVGTKLKLAFDMDKHDTVGIDCVAMCVNDVICCGARPLFFLDYLAVGKLDPEKAALIVKGVADGCVEAGCALIGGETAEHPGLMPPDEYDLAGFCVGIVDRKRLINNNRMSDGNKIIGIQSSGVHSNGFSLIRKLFGDSMPPGLAKEFLTPTRIYAKSILSLIEEVRPLGIAHITGGGFIENVPRAIKDGYCAIIEKSAVQTPEIFRTIQKKGVREADMWNTFNMGIGMVAIVSQNDESRALEILKNCGETAYTIGYLKKGNKEVILC